MKRAVSISIGSSKRNKAVEVTLLGEKVSIERIGTDGDMEAAALKYKELDGLVDAFGVGGGDLGLMDQARDLGPTRLAFWDAPLCSEWVERIGRDNLLFTEVKTENQIDRIAGVAKNPRQTERVPAGSLFDFRLSIKLLDIDGDGSTLQNTVLAGLRRDGKADDAATELDMDGDGKADDSVEETDIDGDSVDDAADSDIDGDAVDNAEDIDDDGDGVHDSEDKDADGDGTEDEVETGAFQLR